VCPPIRALQALQSGQKIVIDLDFADLMTDTELRSICQQLGYCWHANCAARAPAHLALTSLHVRRRLLLAGGLGLEGGGPRQGLMLVVRGLALVACLPRPPTSATSSGFHAVL
jgi:hypothetical protein